MNWNEAIQKISDERKGEAGQTLAAPLGSASFKHPNKMSPRLMRILGMPPDERLFKRFPRRPDSRPGYQPPRKRRALKPAKDKYARYRHRLRAEGRCPKCGKLCEPYAMCEFHREYNRKHSILGASPLTPNSYSKQ